ncbi:hypothetical protein Tco_0178443 [Tanacetum coccineum]
MKETSKCIAWEDQMSDLHTLLIYYGKGFKRQCPIHLSWSLEEELPSLPSEEYAHQIITKKAELVAALQGFRVKTGSTYGEQYLASGKWSTRTVEALGVLNLNLQSGSTTELISYPEGLKGLNTCTQASMLNMEAEEYVVGDLGEPANYKKLPMLDPDRRARCGVCSKLGHRYRDRIQEAPPRTNVTGFCDAVPGSVIKDIQSQTGLSLSVNGGAVRLETKKQTTKSMSDNTSRIQAAIRSCNEANIRIGNYVGRLE